MLDGDIRYALLENLRAADPGAVLYEELPLARGVGRADCASVNGSLHGYEIKSDQDSLSRLARQIANYELVFDYCTIVLTSRHLKSARKLIPARWGIKLASNESSTVAIHPVRKARLNSNTDIQCVIRLVWKQELFAVLRRNGVQCSINMPVADMWDKLAGLPKRLVASEVRNVLKSR